MAVGQPIAAQQLKSGLGQRDVAILGALAAVDMDHHARAIDIGDFEMESLVKAQAAGVYGGKVGVVVEGFDVGKKASDFFDAQDGGKAPFILGAQDSEDAPVAVEDFLVEEAYPAVTDPHGLGGPVIDVFAVEKVVLEFLLRHQIGGFAIELRKHAHRAGVGLLRAFSFTVELQGVDHALIPIVHFPPGFDLQIQIFLLLVALIVPFAFPGNPVFSFKVVDLDQEPLEGATVVLLVDGEEIFSDVTNEQGETGRVELAPGTSFTMTVSKTGFQEYSEVMEATNSVLLYTVALELLEERTYNIALKDSLGQPIRSPLTLSFTCKNPDVEPPRDLPVLSGLATVTEPAGCDGLIVSVQGEGFDFVDSIALTLNNQTIFLQETIGDTGRINVELYFQGQAISENVTVYLYKDNETDAGLGPIESAISENGLASFDRQPGTYFIKSSAEAGYAAATGATFSLSTGDVKTIRLELQQNIVGTIKLKIVDSITNGAVDGANVLLRLGADEKDTKISSADDGGIVEFPVVQDTTYTVVVDHEAYCLKTMHDAEIGESTRTVELVPFTEDCGGLLKVRILDQDGKPVRNATVGLYNEEGFSVGFADLVSDINGVAEFSRAPSGDYKAFAFKGHTSGWSEVQHFIQRAADQTILTVVLIAGNGTVKVNVTDNEGTPLQFANVAFVDALTLETIGGGSMPVEDINGSAEISLRADKKIYIVASRDGYTNFTSLITEVLPGETQVINAVLEKEIIQGDIGIKFNGMYKDGKAAMNIAPGEQYDAMFELRIPVNTNYDSIGMHVRTGTHEIMELDKIVVKSINAPGDVDIIKVTSYNPNQGYAIDSEHLSSDEAKWANLRWPVFSTGIIQVAAKVRIKETAVIGDQLNLFYRAWGEDNGSYSRDPIDSDLGDAESVAGKEGLYAETNMEIFQLDIENICDESFCFSASVIDLQEELSYSASDSFSGKVFRPYKLSYTIVNNSEYETNSYMDAEVKISSAGSGLLLQNYNINGAQGQQRAGIASGSSTEWIAIGNFLPNNTTSGSIEFTPQKSGLNQIVIEIRSGQRIRFTRTIAVNIAAESKMTVTVSPELLPSGIENTITVTAKNESTRAEIEGALVKAKDRFGTVVAERTTNSKGIAELRLPALQPGETLQLIVGKPDYESFEKTLEVNPDVIEVKPETIGIALNAKTMAEASDNFTMENITSFDILIKDLELNGKLYGLVDREKVNNWLYSYIGETVKAGEVKELQLLSFLTEKGKKIEERKNLEATLDVTTEAFGSEWLVSVPVKITVGLGGEVDDPACFTVTRKSWEAGTEGNPIEIEFEVQNNCSIDGIPIDIRDISAQVAWESNQVGTFTITTADNVMDLRSGYAKKFKDTLVAEETVSVVLTFTPNGGVNGKANAVLVFSANNRIESGSQELTDEIAADITVVNMADCLVFSKEVLIIKPEKSDSFTIETIGCGPGNDIRLESDLTLSKEQVTLNEKDSRDIEVFAEKNIAGQYPINVYAKGSDEVQDKLIKTIRARILASGCIELSKYEFDIFDNPDDAYDAYDTAEVINHCADKPVTATVQFDEHDWGEAMKTGAIYGIIMGVIGGFAQGAAKTGGEKTTEAVGEATGQKTSNTSGGILGGIGGLLFGKKTEGDKKTTDGENNDGESKDNTTGSEGGEDKGLIGGAVDWAWGGISGLFGGGGDSEEKTDSAEIVLGAPTGYAAAGAGMGGMMMNNLIYGMGQSVLGKPSALGWGLQGFLVGTITAYMNQDEGEFQFTTIQDDLVFSGIALFMPGASLEDDALVETPSEDIVVRDLDETKTEPRLDNPMLNTEIRKIGFLNVGGVVQEDPATPIFRILRFDGERIEYVTEYEMDAKEYPTITEKERKDHKERFRLQFNAFDPMAIKPDTKPLLNCQLGTVSGETGPGAVPKVAFDWSWSKIKEDSCEEGNEDYIYCDATQFSISVLQKVQKLKEFIEANKPFDCPSSASAYATKEQPLVGTAADIALTKIQASKVGSNDVNVVVIAESNNSGETMEAELRIDLKQGNSLVKSCTRQFNLQSRSIVSCDFTGLANGEYEVIADITPILCATCEDTDPDNDTIEVSLLIGSSGIAECEPYNTKRLVQFLEASNYSQQQIEELQNLIKFNAYLIEDAYTPDFRADFDEFCKTKSFFDCPTYYLDNEGLHRFFSDTERFKFDYSLAPHASVDAGKYSVTLNIEFDNQNWDLFENGVPSAVINIEMTELSAPDPQSPFYYMPFDGLVGVDSANGRQGYGVNFRQTTEKTIKINNTIDQTILSTNIASSTPVFSGWIDAGFNDQFNVLNQTSRGILLDVQSAGETTKVTMSPSYATPVVMQVDYSQGLDAYGFYSLEINNSPQTASTKMVPWSGIGVTCRDFADNPVTEAWDETWDTHGGISGNLSCAVGTDITDYGVEWCSPKRSGSVFLESVVFTPQGSDSIMRRSAYSDGMVLFNAVDAGGQISLNGVPGMANNSYGTSGIDSIEDVFDLVKENKVCIVGQSRISNRFFWNPKVVLEEMGPTRSMAEDNCINSS